MRFDDLRKIGIINTLRFNWRYFGGVKPKILISRNVILKTLKGEVSIENPTLGGVKIGFGSVGIIDEKRDKTIWENSGNVCFQGHARLNVGTKIVCGSTGRLSFGENVQVTGRSSFICYQEISIGDDCLISWDNLLMDTDFHKIYNLDSRGDIDKALNGNKAITIGKHTWVGCRCMILKGAYIPENSVVAAGSVITKKLETSNAVYVNDDVKRERVGWQS